MDVYNEIKHLIAERTGIEFLKLAKRGNEAIKVALNTVKSLNKTKCYIQDQGGWLTYKKFAEKAGFEVHELKTNDCQLDLKHFEEEVDSDSVLLITSLSGYFYEQPMSQIDKICKSKGCLLINDCTGSISKNELLLGDLFVCSFGSGKPINNESGGFIGTRDKRLFDEIYYNDSEEIKTPENIIEQIKGLDKRIEYLNQISAVIISKLQNDGFSVLNKDSLNLVVIAPFSNDEEQERMVQIAEGAEVDFEICPREIRVLRDAVSFEVKRK